jgi:hypothetical protein
LGNGNLPLIALPFRGLTDLHRRHLKRMLNVKQITEIASRAWYLSVIATLVIDWGLIA